MTIEITRKAIKELDKIPDQIAKKISQEILKLAKNPFPANSTKLQGRDNYRIRIGVYRAIYTIDEKTKSLTILRIAHRRHVYR